MDSAVKLKNGAEVQVRPLKDDDIERSFAFFQELPEEDRIYLRGDVTRREVVEKRIRDMNLGKVRRIVATDGDRIVADGAMELANHGWAEHVGELRLIVSREYQRRGLGTLMARELYGIAAREKVEEIIVRLMRPQKAVHQLFHRRGFTEETVVPDMVKDTHGQKQDLIFMRCSLRDLWKVLEEYLLDSDWERRR